MQTFQLRALIHKIELAINFTFTNNFNRFRNKKVFEASIWASNHKLTQPYA